MEKGSLTVFWRIQISKINIIAVLLGLLIINHCDVPFRDLFLLKLASHGSPLKYLKAMALKFEVGGTGFQSVRVFLFC